MTNPFMPKFVKNLFPNNVPMQESFFHVMLHKATHRDNPAQNQEPIEVQRKWTAEDYKNYDDYLQLHHELELAYQAAELERKLASKAAAKKRKLASQAEEDRRLKELLEHAMQYGEVESIEYKKGGYSVVYKKQI